KLLVFLPRFDDAVALASADVQHDVAEDPVRKSTGATPIHDRKAPQPVGPFAERRRPLLDGIAEAPRKPAAQEEELVPQPTRDHVSPEPARIFQVAGVCEPGVEIDHAL